MYIASIKKHGHMKYISHLDMIRLFRSAFKIAGVRLVYSKGFNPHPKMSFALPLPLGYSSDCEILEFEIKERLEPGKIKDDMNAILPEGIAITECKATEEEKSAAATVIGAAYEIYLPAGKTGERPVSELTDGFLKQDEITAVKIQKKTGRKKETDIKKMIKSLGAETTENGVILYADLDAGSSSNLSPELLIAAFLTFTGFDIKREEIDVKRTGLFLKHSI